MTASSTGAAEAAPPFSRDGQPLCLSRQLDLPRLGQRRCVRCSTPRVNHCAERLMLPGEAPNWPGLRRKLIWLCPDCLPVYQRLGLLVSAVRTTKHQRTDGGPFAGIERNAA